MDKAIWWSVARQALTVIGTLLASRGLIDGAQVGQAVDTLVTAGGATVAAGSLIWSVVRAKQVKAAVEAAAVTGVAAQPGLTAPVRIDQR